MRLLLFFGFLGGNILRSQVTNTATLDTTGGQQIGNTSIGGYLDLYYGYNLNQPSGNAIPYYVSSNRHNELNVNLAFVDLRYQSESIRANCSGIWNLYE
ncbi:MAG: outer membrane beta-barrel protein [Crocinitomicaceae bacterium]|nr:outer membrane beta-barrel protein [Crocinitomicaceae bacterium]